MSYTSPVISFGYTFEVFRQVIADERFMSAMSSDLGRIMEIVAQFQKKIVPDLGSTEGSPEYIGNIVSALIMAGLDAHYALNEMELCDLPLYPEAYERKRKEEMESSACGRTSLCCLILMQGR